MNLIDPVAVYLGKRNPRKDGLTPEQRIAINLLRRKKHSVTFLAKVFGVSKNTIYYKALTGSADSYPNSKFSNSAADTNAVIEHLGVEEAERRFITPDINRRIQAELRRDPRAA